MLQEKNHSRRAYLLRCWREEETAPDQPPRYRFSVEEVLHRQSWKGFESLEALFALLQDELAGGEDEDGRR